MRFAIAFLLFLHGFAHQVGFIGAFRLKEDVPFRPDILNGSVTLNGPGLKAYGLAWLALTFGFLFSAIAAVEHAQWWTTAALTMTTVSLGMCVIGWPESRIGVYLNVALLIVLGAIQHLPYFAALR